MKRHALQAKIEPPAPKSDVRPKHKARLREEASKAAHEKLHPEPMALFNKRIAFGLVPQGGTYRKPEVTAGKVDQVASAIGKWDLSDPFAYSRTALHARQGYIDIADTVKEYEARTLARRVARSREVEAAKIAERQQANG